VSAVVGESIERQMFIYRAKICAVTSFIACRVEDNGSAGIMPQPNNVRKGSFASEKPTGYHTGRCTNI